MLACAIALDGEAGVYGLSADTDGIDGSEWTTAQLQAQSGADGLNSATVTLYQALGGGWRRAAGQASPLRSAGSTPAE